MIDVGCKLGDGYCLAEMFGDDVRCDLCGNWVGDHKAYLHGTTTRRFRRNLDILVSY